GAHVPLDAAGAPAHLRELDFARLSPEEREERHKRRMRRMWARARPPRPVAGVYMARLKDVARKYGLTPRQVWDMIGELGVRQEQVFVSPPPPEGWFGES